jgi:hypothetical protein
MFRAIVYIIINIPINIIAHFPKSMLRILAVTVCVLSAMYSMYIPVNIYGNINIMNGLSLKAL